GQPRQRRAASRWGSARGLRPLRRPGRRRRGPLPPRPLRRGGHLRQDGARRSGRPAPLSALERALEVRVKGASLRGAVRRVLDPAGGLARLLWLRARLGRRDLAVLTYHRVGDDDGTLDPGLFDTTPAELGAELEVLRAHATAVSIADVRRA